MMEQADPTRRIVDAHVHMGGLDEEDALLAVRRATGIDQMALVAIQMPATGSGLPQALYMKARHPARFFVFAGLNHAARLTSGAVASPSLAEQVDLYSHCGCDGIKMIEGKPTSRQRLDVPLTDPYYAEYWRRVEETGTPVVCHVNDPEEFWDPARLPAWAAERKWGYGPGDVQKEQLYAEVERVLTTHPRLRIVFAHFYFLSADLPRAARFLDAHPTVGLDLAPGIEMLYNISRDPEAGREFFVRYADRIFFGTDLGSGLKEQEAKARAGIVTRWLETADVFRVPSGADFLLGPPEDGIIRGMSLPENALRKIYRGNFVKMASAKPRPLDAGMAVEVCEGLAAISEAMTGARHGSTEAALVAARLSARG